MPARALFSLTSGVAAVAAAAAGFREQPTAVQLAATTVAAMTMTVVAWVNAPFRATFTNKKKTIRFGLV